MFRIVFIVWTSYISMLVFMSNREIVYPLIEYPLIVYTRFIYINLVIKHSLNSFVLFQQQQYLNIYWYQCALNNHDLSMFIQQLSLVVFQFYVKLNIFNHSRIHCSVWIRIHWIRFSFELHIYIAKSRDSLVEREN